MEVAEWIESSLSELERAIRCLKLGDYPYACFHAHQAAEHALKAFLLSYGNFLKSHDLQKLIERAKKYNLVIKVSRKDIERLTIHYYASRYPNARRRYGVSYTEEEAKKSIEIASSIVREVRKCLSI